MDPSLRCKTISLLGLDFADLDATRAAAAIARRPDGAPFGYVVTPNADHLVRLERQPELLSIYRGALLRLMDSRMVSRAAHILGLSAPSVAPGSDVTARLLGYHLRSRERVTIVGLRPAFLPALVERCGIAPPAHHDPAMGFARDPAALQAAVEFVIAHPARFVFLAVGSPAQEILAAAIQATGRAVGTGLCAGASLDFLSGAAQRAPVLMQRAGLEWLHRMASDPARLARRYLHDDPPVFRMLMRERFPPSGKTTTAVPD
jgi:N-acetylglucosaminyldiphosphoundecaprenol N-acetyl-beta-D-mannosaminyltransferase